MATDLDGLLKRYNPLYLLISRFDEHALTGNGQMEYDIRESSLGFHERGGHVGRLRHQTIPKCFRFAMLLIAFDRMWPKLLSCQARDHLVVSLRSRAICRECACVVGRDVRFEHSPFPSYGLCAIAVSRMLRANEGSSAQHRAPCIRTMWLWI